MPRRRGNTTDTMEYGSEDVATITEGENGMSTTEQTVDFSDAFEVIDKETWEQEGGAGAAERGLYAGILTSFAAKGARHARLVIGQGRWAGKKASSVATALKNTKDGKNAPAGVGHLKITSKGDNAEKGIPGVVYLENPQVEDES